ncbi:Uncharacterised protein [Mycobacteroides abscessus subsp. abscessus]|nr:Uncharacterised protein [Mycobacteroides abscessus subsp. abscessus]
MSPITLMTPTRRRKSNSDCRVSASAAAPCGLWAASRNTAGALRTRSKRPGMITEAKPERIASMSS